MRRVYSVQLALPWVTGKLLRGEIVCGRRLDDLPEDALRTKQARPRIGIKSALIVPVSLSGVLVCVLGIGAVRAEIDWPSEWIPLLRLLGALFAHALRRKRTEEASNHLWHDLAHAARVAMLGELVASMARELRQPLTAGLSNAQAAHRFLALESPDLAEVHEALRDIIAADQRAGKIIQPLRALGKKAEVAV